MEIIVVIIAILAAVAGSALVVNLLPFSLDKRLNPLVMFLAALLALVLPHVVVLALAMTIPMGLIYGWTGVRLQGFDTVRVPVDKITDQLVRLKRTPKVEVKEILTREYPLPDSEGTVEKFVPEL
jgi:hypothetical protein